MSSQYTNDRAYSNSWLVYINGLQMPAAGASVAHGVWQIPEASVQLVPDNTALRIAQFRFQHEAHVFGVGLRAGIAHHNLHGLIGMPGGIVNAA